MPPIMPPFYFVTKKLKGSGSSFPKATSIAKISSMVILLQIMKYHPEITLPVFSRPRFKRNCKINTCVILNDGSDYLRTSI